MTKMLINHHIQWSYACAVGFVLFMVGAISGGLSYIDETRRMHIIHTTGKFGKVRRFVLPG